MIKPFLVISSALLLCQCGQSSRNEAITANHYVEIAGKEGKSPAKYRVTMKFIEDGKVSSAPVMVARPGKEVRIVSQRDFVYPTEFKHAEAARLRRATAGGTVVTPITPTEFTTRELGYTASLNVTRNGGFVIVKGMLSHEKFAAFSRAPGEAISPIVDAQSRTLINDNRVDLPNFVRSETPLYVAGLPGVEHVVDLPAIPAKVAIICEPID